MLPTLRLKIIKICITFLCVVVIPLLVFGGYSLYSINTKDPFGTPQNLQGTLLLSASAISTTTQESTGIAPFAVQVSTGIADILPFNLPSDELIMTLQHSFASDQSAVVFLGIPFKQREMERQEGPFVYFADLMQAASSEGIIDAIQNATIVAEPTDSDYFRESPAVSVNHEIAYSSLSKNTFELMQSDLTRLSAEEWTIYIKDAEGKSGSEIKGLKPKWVNSNTIAYLKNDGVYSYDTVTKVEQRIWILNFKPNIATGFDVSDDGTLAVVTNPHDSSLTIKQISDWDTPSILTIKEEYISATSPVFAPDNSYIAMFTGILDNSTDQPITQISYYNLATFSFLGKTVRFEGDTINGLYLTDWQ